MGTMYVYAALINTENLKIALWCAVAGVILAFVAIFFNKAVNGALVRALLDADGVSADGGKTLSELGFENPENVIRSYRRSDTLRRIVGTDKEELDEKTRFFVRDGELERARQQFGRSKYEFLIMIVGSVFVVAVGVVITVLI